MKNPPVVEKIRIRYQDIDTYGHVNNALHATYFESLRMAYWKRLAEQLDLGPLEAGDLPGARYVLAEATIRYKASIFLKDSLFGAASVRAVGNRSFVMDYELRVGESFEGGRLVAGGESAQVFYQAQTGEVKPRPEWFLTAIAELEGRPEESFAPEKRS